jgi:hypothetical protein
MNSAQDTLTGGFPHSEIPGSPIARISPGLFAACHVLHRLSVPRHPPDALVSRLIKRIAVTGDATPPPRTGPNPSRKPTGPNPCLSRNRGKRRSRMKTLLSDIPQSQPCWRHPRQAKLGFAGKGGPNTLAPGLSASVTSLLSLHPSISPAALRPRRVSPIFSEPRSSSAGACRARRWFAGGTSRRSFAEPVKLARLCFAGAFGVAYAAPVARPQLRCDRGGGERIRTDDLLLAKQALSQLSYTPAQRSADQRSADQRSADRACPGESQAIRPFAIPDD